MNMHTIDEIRRIRMRELADELGGISALAKKLGKSQGQVSGLLNGVKDSKTGKRRGMHSDTARAIEVTCNKPRGWLDSLAPAALIQTLAELSPEESEQILNSLVRIGPENLTEASVMLRAYAEGISAAKGKSGQ